MFVQIVKMASESLIWNLIRDSNSFLVKRGNTKRDGAVQFSCEPGNLMNVHSFKYSGLANKKAVDLQVETDKKAKEGKKNQVVMKKKNFKVAASNVAYSNAKSVSKIPLNKDYKSGVKAVTALVGSGKGVGKGKKPFAYSYRSDLVGAATLRFKKLKKAADVSNGKGKGALKATKRNSRKP